MNNYSLAIMLHYSAAVIPCKKYSKYHVQIAVLDLQISSISWQMQWVQENGWLIVQIIADFTYKQYTKEIQYSMYYKI